MTSRPERDSRFLSVTTVLNERVPGSGIGTEIGRSEMFVRMKINSTGWPVLTLVLPAMIAHRSPDSTSDHAGEDSLAVVERTVKSMRAINVFFMAIHLVGQRPRLSDPAREGVRLQTERDGRVRCSAWLLYRLTCEVRDSRAARLDHERECEIAKSRQTESGSAVLCTDVVRPRYADSTSSGHV